MMITSRHGSWRVCAASAACALLGACATYRADPLATEPESANMRGRAALVQRAADFSHPRLRPVHIDFGAPLTPEALGVIAVLSNPDLKAARARAGVASAQLFAAGLLPDPQVSLAYDKFISGPDTLDAFAGSIALELNALRTRRVAVAAERAAEAQVRLDLAWQEWQTAGQARLLAARISGLEAIGALNAQARDLTAAALSRALLAASRGDLRADEVEARRVSASDAGDRARATERDLAAARLELNKLLGAPARTHFEVAALGPAPASLYHADALFERARADRLDLEALRKGYDSEESLVRRAVMDAFPSLQLTLSGARDTADNQTIGPGVSFTLPLWNRNRGGVAVAVATRRQLRAEYDARLAATQADIAALAEGLELEARQREVALQQVAPLERLAASTALAAARGDLALATGEIARQSVTDKRLTIAALDQAMAEQRVTLELAVGAPLSESAR